MEVVHDCMRLHVTNEKFYIEPVDTGTDELLVIDRVTQEISLQGNDGQIPANTTVKTIHGIIGIIRLLAGPYLVVITGKAKVGSINGQDVWKVTSTEALSYKRTTMHLNEQQITDNKTYLSMVEHALSMESYYFSATYDITHSMQRLNNTSPDFVSIPLYERADQRFVWNSHLLRELAQQPELARYCMPIMLGFVSVTKCTVNAKAFTYILVSRRSCFRAGTRYYMRGLDSEGHAANYVETEQMVEFEGSRCSFVQTRGSVPLFWSQFPNLKYKPDPQLSSSQDHMDGFQRHFATQIYNYGKQCIINLLDQKGKEDLLVKNYANAVDSSKIKNHLRYEAFDFHHECRKMRWHRLSILVDRLEEDQKCFGFFHTQPNGSVVRTQDGVFRTNCIDCLDRTNVVQGMLGKKSLQEQLEVLGLLQAGQRVETEPNLEETLRNVWADNADACARQYAGTGALKTDFTRTGKRTFLGLLKDGINASFRYIMNNFYDGYRQDSIDLILGNYIVEESEGIVKPSPLRQDRDWKVYALPTICVVAMSMCVISILIPDEHFAEQLMYVMFWGGASIISFGAIRFYGDDFVQRPKLALSKSKME